MSDTLLNNDDPWITKLIKTCKDRGSVAALGKYWSPTTESYAFPVLGRLGIANLKHPDAITAAVYTLNPNHKHGGNTIGKACLKLAGGSFKADSFASFEPHMRRLVACKELMEVKYQLRRISLRLKGEGINLDYNQLMWDLRNWAKKSDQIKTRWAMHFWQAPVSDETTTEASAT